MSCSEEDTRRRNLSLLNMLRRTAGVGEAEEPEALDRQRWATRERRSRGLLDISRNRSADGPLGTVSEECTVQETQEGHGPFRSRDQELLKSRGFAVSPLSLSATSAASFSGSGDAAAGDPEGFVGLVPPPPLHGTAYSQQLLAFWTAASGPLAAIGTHPFLQGLVDGSLEMVKFQRYIRQNTLCLERFTRALSLLAARAPTLAAMAELTAFAASSSAGERFLQAGFIAEWEIDDALGISHQSSERAPADQGERNPTCELYTGWILAAAAVEPFAVALTAVLPCYWVYLYVGKLLSARRAECTIITNKVRPPAYDQWIDAYAGEDFESCVARCVGLVDMAASATPGDAPAMNRIFRRGCELEYMFWESAWTLEDWREFQVPLSPWSRPWARTKSP